MSEQSQEPVFFCEKHRAFLENSDANALRVEALRPYLYKLMTDHRDRGKGDNCGAVLVTGALGIFGVLGGIECFLILGSISISYLVENGFPHWRLVIYAFIMGGWLLIPATLALYACLGWLKEAILMTWWTTGKRITNLISQIAQEGTLIQGRLEPIEIEHKMQLVIPYHFIKPSGEKAFGKFSPTPFPNLHYLDVEKKFQPGTSVWVLYLNDKISVLL